MYKATKHKQMEETTSNCFNRAQSFIPQDPNADLSGKHASLYITQKTLEGEGFSFNGYIWSANGLRKIEGYITPSIIRFVADYKKSDDGSTKLQFQGEFATMSSLYEVGYKEPKATNTQYFDLINQKVFFESFSRPPLPPFFLYKRDIFDEVKQQNPHKKLSELTSLIAQMWNSLEVEKQNFYQQKYEELLKTYKDSWKDPSKKNSNQKTINDNKAKKTRYSTAETSESKKMEVSTKKYYLTNVFGAIRYGESVIHSRGRGGYEDRIVYKNLWRYHDAWLRSLDYVKKVYRMLTKECEELGQLDEDLILEYENQPGKKASLDFQATIIDFEEGVASAISEKKLKLELAKQIQCARRTKRFLIIDILREKDFNAQTIREVLSFLPKGCNKLSYRPDDDDATDSDDI